MYASFASSQESELGWLPLAFSVGYVLLGFVLFGNWEGYGFIGKTIYFLIFPFHIVVIKVILLFHSGVHRHLAIWKMAVTTVFVILFLFMLLLMMAPK